MSLHEQAFAKLFQNASEGQASGPILGHLPDWFMSQDTTIIYNGPVGVWDHAEQTVNNWFDGLAILTLFKMEGPLVHARKRFLKSEAFAKAQAHGRLIITEYGTAGSADPDKGLMSKLVSSLVPGEMTDNCACNVFKLGGLGLVASTETCLLRRIDGDTLETLEKIDLSPLVNIASGRALQDPDSGEVYNLAGSFLTGLKYHFVRFNRGQDQVLSPKDLLGMTKFQK
jgi:beta,beta-carotene 9',10'-dioxygenase